MLKMPPRAYAAGSIDPAPALSLRFLNRGGRPPARRYPSNVSSGVPVLSYCGRNSPTVQGNIRPPQPAVDAAWFHRAHVRGNQFHQDNPAVSAFFSIIDGAWFE